MKVHSEQYIQSRIPGHFCMTPPPLRWEPVEPGEPEEPQEPGEPGEPQEPGEPEEPEES